MNYQKHVIQIEFAIMEGQFVVDYDYFDSFSVDTKKDLIKVRKFIRKDKIYKKFNI